MKKKNRKKLVRLSRLLMNSVLVGIFLITAILGCTSKKDHSNVQYAQRLSVEKLNEWQDLKYGMFIHFGMSTFLGEELPDGNASIDTYAPTDLDVAQWVRVAKDAGMSYAVLTAKHVAGHCLWPSAYTGYDVSNSIDTTDVVGKFVKECRKQGIQPGIYYCSWDNRHTFGSVTPSKGKYGGAIVTPTEDNPGTDAAYTSHLYQNFMTAQIDELLEKYSPLVEFWIDIPIVLGNGYRTFIYNHITQKYPDMLVIMNHGHLIKDGDFVFLEDKAWPTDVFTLERFHNGKPYNPIRKIKGKEIYFPAETCLTLGNEWFWEDDDKVKPMEDLVEIFESSFENKINLLLNVPPDRTGQIPEKWIKPLMELKEKMKRP